MSWLTAFKVIPWRDIVENAPAAVSGAKKLWSLVGKGQHAPAPEAAPEQASAGLESRLVSLAQETARLKAQVADSAVLLATLAEQNDRLIQAVEVLRVRTRLLAIACAVLATGGLAAVLVAIFR